eukprot:4111547-Amphidinium_carterae.1
MVCITARAKFYVDFVNTFTFPHTLLLASGMTDSSWPTCQQVPVLPSPMTLEIQRLAECVKAALHLKMLSVSAALYLNVCEADVPSAFIFKPPTSGQRDSNHWTVVARSVPTLLLLIP